MTNTAMAGNQELPVVSLAEKAYQLLVRKITHLELRPGSVLAEKWVMAELEIGRTPVREALQRLSAEGLVSHMPNRGMLVTDISASNVQHIYEFRSVIDAFMARLAATRASKSDIIELTELAKKMVQATDADDLDQFIHFDREFYETMARASQNIYVEEAVPRIFNLHLRLWLFISNKVGDWRDTMGVHQEMTQGIVTALRARTPDDAELTMKMYISRRQQQIKELL
jgi:GntR family transcriptional regulator, rspAB operon transcriptional repressor